MQTGVSLIELMQTGVGLIEADADWCGPHGG